MIQRAIACVAIAYLIAAGGFCGAEDDADSLFQQRIMPIFRSPNPSSCVQCHLSSVDLKDYILPSHEQTFVSLRDQGLVDLDHPKDSKILKLIERGDRDTDQQAKLIHQSYKSFLAWIQDYARLVRQEYRESEDLPRDNWYPSKHVLRVKELPQRWPAMSRVQLFVHAWNNDRQQWDDSPTAFTQGLVTPRRFAGGSLFLLKPSDNHDDWDSSGAALEPGDYLIKVFLDSKQVLATDPTALLSSEDYRGSLETHGVWGEGFKNAKTVSAADLMLTGNESTR